MTFKYSITHIPEDSTQRLKLRNFKSKKKLIEFLDANKDSLRQLKSVRVHFASIDLPLKDTVWKS